MLARLGHKVMRLKRVALGPVHLSRVPTGKARPLTPRELEMLRRAAGPRPGDQGARRQGDKGTRRQEEKEAARLGSLKG